MCARRASSQPAPWYRPEGFVAAFAAFIITIVVVAGEVRGDFGGAVGIIGPMAGLLAASGGAGIARVVFEKRDDRRRNGNGGDRHAAGTFSSEGSSDRASGPPSAP